MIELQVTLIQREGKYRPMSTLVKIDSIEYYKEHKKEVQKRAIENICHQRMTDWKTLQKQGYTQVKVREYDREKIKAQQEQQHTLNLLKYIDRKRKEKK